jgi:hypothetical protein
MIGIILIPHRSSHHTRALLPHVLMHVPTLRRFLSRPVVAAEDAAILFVVRPGMEGMQSSRPPRSARIPDRKAPAITHHRSGRNKNNGTHVSRIYNENER